MKELETFTEIKEKLKKGELLNASESLEVVNLIEAYEKWTFEINEKVKEAKGRYQSQKHGHYIKAIWDMEADTYQSSLNIFKSKIT